MPENSHSNRRKIQAGRQIRLVMNIGPMEKGPPHVAYLLSTATFYKLKADSADWNWRFSGALCLLKNETGIICVTLVSGNA
jgi:hypothetical protein